MNLTQAIDERKREQAECIRLLENELSRISAKCAECDSQSPHGIIGDWFYVPNLICTRQYSGRPDRFDTAEFRSEFATMTLNNQIAWLERFREWSDARIEESYIVRLQMQPLAA